MSDIHVHVLHVAKLLYSPSPTDIGSLFNMSHNVMAVFNDDINSLRLSDAYMRQ